MKRWKSIPAFLLLIWYACGVNAQTGPGGVGNSTNVPVWLRASDLSVGDGNEIITWPDKSGNGNDFTSFAGNGGLRPILRTSSINGQPGVLFHGDASRFEDEDGENYINNQTGYTLLTLIQSDELATIDVGIFDSEDPDGADDEFTWRYDNAGAYGGGDNVIKFGVEAGGQNQYESADDTHTVDPQLMLGLWQQGEFNELWLDGVQDVPTNQGTIQTGLVTGASKAVIGRGPKDNGSTGWDGYVLEFAIIQYKVNNAERILIENYLAAKYKLPVANDFYIFENTHGHDVSGIGQTGADSHTNSYSGDIIGVGSPSALNDGDWLLFGHDNADVSTWTSAEQINGDPNLERIAREWRFDVTNDPGTVTLSIDPSNLPVLNADFDFYTLWVDSDGDFSNGAVAYPLTLNGGIYEAYNLTIADGDYVTVGAYRPNIQFTNTNSAGDEEASNSPDFNVRIDYAISADIDVDYAINGGTAVINTEYTFTDGTLTIPAGNTSANITTAAILPDGDVEPDETFIIELANPEFGILGSNTTHTYTINDNDNTQIIQFDAPFSYAYKKHITVNSSQVSGSSNLDDFPVMISFTDVDFETASGKIQNTSGFDVRFTLANSVVWLDHDLEYYNGATGEYVAWVRIPSLSYNEDTEIDMYYGNANVVTDPSSTSTWVDYHAVYHMGDDNFTDASINGYNGTNSGTSDAVGKTGRSQSFDGSSQINLNTFPNLDGAFTISMWINAGAAAQNGMLFSDDVNNSGYFLNYGQAGNERIRGTLRGTGFSPANIDDTYTYTAGTWQYVSFVIDRPNLDRIIYANGNSSISDLSDIGLMSTDAGVASIGGEGARYFNGSIDEVRVSSVVRNAAWIATEFNNQDDPSTFLTIDPVEEVVTGFDISESTATVALTVTINAASGSLTQVNYAATAGSAINGSDYTLASGTVDINIGETSNYFELSITNDLIYESDETITISLSSPTNANLGTNNTITLTIVDNDNGPEVQFASSAVTVNEGTSQFYVPVQLSAVAGQDVSATYTVTGGSATANSDFVLNSGTITILAGSLTNSFIANIIDDGTIETLETIEITLSNPTPSPDILIGTDDVITISISDNDNLGYDGPGGVGYKDGSGTLTMWYMADSATVTGGKVTDLKNLVGNSAYDMITPAADPDYISYDGTGTLNGHAEISFNNVEDNLATNSVLSASTFPYNEATSFIVTRHDNMSQQANTYGTSNTQTGGQAVNRFGSHLPWNGIWYYDIGNWNAGGRLNAAYDPTWVGEYGIFTYRADASSGGTKTAWRNNTQIGSNTGTSEFLNHTSSYFQLGQSETNDFQGDIVEFLLFTKPINEAQRIIINNYLAAKYDLPITNDYYVWQSTHSFEVAGIGQTSGESHVAAKAGAITISAPTNLDDDEYVLFGHDNEDITTWSTSDIPDGDFQRLDREWRFDLTGTPGEITISIDPDMVITEPVGYNEYVILVDGDGNFSSGAAIYPTTLISGEYTTESIAVTKGDYVTLALLKRTAEFSSSGIISSESNQGLVTVQLDYAAGSTITMDYTLTGTATSGGVDYAAATTGTFTILEGQASSTLDLGIIDESIKEGDETIIITLSNPSANLQLGAQASFTYTISDDDNTRDIFFNAACEFGFSKVLTINSGEVIGSADLTNFPLLVNIAGDADLAANVQNANGYDIYFKYQDSTFWLDHDIEYFNSGNGDFVAWVLLPTLDFDDDTNIEMYYGNSDITTDPSSNRVWDEYLGVWHLHDNEEDATPNEYDGTNNGTDVITGRFGNGRDFDGVGDFIELASFPDLQQDFSITAWVNPTNVNAGSRVFIDDDNNTQGYALSIGDPGSGRVRFYSRGTNPISVDGGAGQAATAAAWNFVSGVADYNAGGSRIIYVNGQEAANVSHTSQMGVDVGSAAIGGETLSGETGNRFTGIMDEVRVYNGLLSPERIQTEYNNQIENSTFYNLPLTEVAGAGCVVAENDGTFSATVSINPFDNASTTTATYTATGGTAVNGEDYTLASGTVTIPQGATSASFEIELTNDLLDEVDETIILTISNPSSNAKIGSNSTITYTIQDDDNVPEIDFVDTQSSINEGTATVTIGLQLNAESGNDVTVQYGLNGSSTGTDNVDFIIPSSTATITAGDLNTNITLSIIDDIDLEALETIILDISSPTNATLGSNIQHTMTINDNDDLGYNGPGGVGEFDGSKTLKLWLAADSAATTGTDVTNWDNAVPTITGLDFTPVGTSPSKIEDAVNGHAEISFANVNDALISNSTLAASTFPYNEATFFIVTRTDNLSQQSNAYSTATAATGATGANNISADIPGTGNYDFDISGVNISNTYPSAWANGDHSIFAHRITSDSSIVWRNNGIIGQTATNSNPFTNHSNYNFYIGREETNPFQGDIAELIMFTRPVNNTQVNIINNYLSSKYDIPVATDLYVFDNTHGNEVAGIGQTSATDQHVAAEAGVITISNASTLADDDYVLFGHDNASIASWVTTDTPEGDSIRRVSREWRFDLNNDPGTITIALDTDLLPTIISGYEDYVIFVDADGDFTDGASVYQTTLVDGQYKASEVPVASGDYVSVGIIIRTIEFNLANSNGLESTSENVGISLNYAYNTDINFDYAITGGTATGGNVDYSTAATGTLQFLSGQTSTSLPLGINNDGLIESDETIIIKLRNVPSGFRYSADSIHTYTINDDDNARSIQFSAAASAGDESVTDIQLTIELNNPDPVNETKAYLSVTGGTAEDSPAPDYTLVADTVRIAATENSVTFDFSVLDDVLDEADETIEISLTSPGNANLGTNAVYTYTIQDNDSPVSLEFQDAATTIDEGGNIAQIVVELSNPSGQTVTVDYAVSGGTAIGFGTDYALADGILSIAPGNQIKSINVALTDDTEEESAETIIIDISSPTGATLGAQTQHTITLIDNDAQYGFYGPGGVGGKKSNQLWLDAENINGTGVSGPTDGATITTWTDRSGNNYDFTAVGIASTYDATGLNGNGTITISNATQGYRAPANFSNSLSNYSFFTVAQQTGGQYLAETTTAASGNFSLNQGANGLYYLNSGDFLVGNSSTDIDITTWIFDAEATPNAQVRRDGTALASDNNFAVMGLSNDFSVASRATGESTADFEGDLSEFIIYKKPLNTAQQNIVENYLSSKYGIAVNTDLYSYDGTYGADVVGIGQEADGQHLQAMSDSLLMLSGASSLGDGDYVFAGHDGGSKLTWTTTEAPNSGSNVRRISREWRTDLTGTPGTVIVKIDTTQLPVPPNGYDQYVVWADADGDFRSGATTYQLEYSPIFGFHVTDPITLADGTFITLGVGQTVVQFSLSSSDGNENVANPNIQVSLNFTMGNDVTVNYAATGGSAQGNNVDYLLTAGTLTIPEGQMSANIIPGVIDDNVLENDETITITLTTPSANVSLGSISEHTYTIHDNDNTRAISFSTPLSDTQLESVASKTVTVEVDVVDPSNPTTVDLELVAIGNTATETDDFTLSTTTVTIPANQSTATFDINIVNDTFYENTEVITIDLTNPNNAQLGTDDRYTYTITDDDTAPTVAYTETSSFASETSGTATIEVSLSTTSVADVTIDYSVTAGTATDGIDYTLADGTLVISAGEMDENILVTLVDDILSESAETITVTISNPSGATLGTNQIHTITIIDNDAAGGTGPGGVGNSTNNVLWLRGDQYDGATWTDISGNNNDLNGGVSPSTSTNINSLATVSFDGSQYLSADALTEGAEDFDFFFVTNSSATSDQVLFHVDGSGTEDLAFGYHHSNGAFLDQNGWTGNELAVSGTNIIQLNLESGSNNAEYSVNGVAQASTTYTPTAISGSRALGALTTGAEGFVGDIGEVIVFNNNLNDAQRIITLNYLSARFNINIGALDRYAYDGAGGFTGNLIGIGREDATNLHVEATSEDYLTVKNPNSLEDGDYLLFANDNADATAWTTTETPNGSTRRIAREWRVDETNEVGTVTLEIDNSALPTPPESGLTWVLMVDSDGDFNTVDNSYPLTNIGGNIVSINGLDFNTGDYFTFALVKFETTGASFDFNNPIAWTTGIVPTEGTDATIVSGHPMFLSSDAVVGSLTIETGASLDLSGQTIEFSDGCITLEGTASVDVATSGSSIGYVNPNVIEQCVTSMTYNNIFTEGTAGSVKYLLGDIVILGDMNLTSASGLAATFDARELSTTNDYDITIAGHWTSEITFLPRSGTVTFDGTADQSIDTDGGETYNNLIINKATGDVDLQSSVSTNGTVTLTSGNIDLGINDLNITSTSTISGGDATSYIVADNIGVLRHAITALSTAYTFPIGDSDEYAPFTFTLNQGTLSSSNVTINMRDTKHTNIEQDDYITRYWSLNNENITGTLDYDVSYTYQQVDVVGTELALKARKFSASGDAIGGSVTVATNVLAYTGHDSFSDHTGESLAIATPVELMSFDALLTDAGVEIHWQTASELNNDYFELERSGDGIAFEVIGKIDGNGTINEIMSYSHLDKDPYYGISYYRLVQVDYDGTYTIYNPIAIDNDLFRSEMELTLFPNPTDEYNINVRIASGDENTPIQILIYDLMGHLVHSETIEAILGISNHQIQSNTRMDIGVYQVVVSQANNQQIQRLIIK
ncbi:MAG: DUF2341 domain-containing protein [Reichenbachiella sp.]|uniref:DUF2341 domain-containing protein n=1 Tax=Reichenbachiella sp. TaxID=2184521 RepID=UPI002966D6D6|nr:DUF2341 domain-containing protein [Reichenbachiella sp.]MDW3209881.1 DUF2341 domain-containing protein [Reichenbachiella sp.]